MEPPNLTGSLSHWHRPGGLRFRLRARLIRPFRVRAWATEDSEFLLTVALLQPQCQRREALGRRHLNSTSRLARAQRGQRASASDSEAESGGANSWRSGVLL
eukprot:2742406-Rhodomonas_salina.3